jgi:hypothetical protein
MALPLPDIAGSAEFSGTHERVYVLWAEKYCKFEASYARSLYRIRCDLLHSLGAKPKGAQRQRFIFTFPEYHGPLRVHSITMKSGNEEAVVLDSILLSEHICNAAKAWYSEVQSDLDKQFKIKQMLRIYPNGIAPFIVGQPIVGFGYQN